MRRRNELARLLVHEQVEVALAIAGLRVGEAVERVRKRAPVPREHVSSSTASDGSPRRDFAGRPETPTTSPEMDVDVARAAGVAHELDAPGAVDQVEEDELPHLAARHDAAGETSHFVELASGLDPFGRGTNVRDRVPIRKSLRRRHVGQPNRRGCVLRRHDPAHAAEVAGEPRGDDVALLEAVEARPTDLPRADHVGLAVVHRDVVARRVLVPERPQAEDRPRYLDRRSPVRAAITTSAAPTTTPRHDTRTAPHRTRLRRGASGLSCTAGPSPTTNARPTRRPFSGSAPQPGGQYRGYVTRTRRQRPP